MKANGKKINNTVLVLRHGQMAPNTTVNMFKERNTVKVLSLGLMDQLIMENS